MEMRIHHGPGYRVYFVERGPLVVILVAGGSKATQRRDIQRAKELAQEVWGSMVARTTTRRWDAADHLGSEEDQLLYLGAAFEEGDASLIAAALGDIARARGMTEVAREAGLGRESLYKALSVDGNPHLDTILKVMRALGLRLHAKAGWVLPVPKYHPSVRSW
jgi:probable addiction module antidote protein